MTQRRFFSGGSGGGGGFVGGWDSSTAYTAEQMVTYGGAVYGAVADSVNVAPVAVTNLLTGAPAELTVADGGDYEFGVRFTVSKRVRLTHLCFYKSSLQANAPHTLKLWDTSISTTQPIAANTASGELTGSTGVQAAPMVADLLPGRTYIATVTTGLGSDTGYARTTGVTLPIVIGSVTADTFLFSTTVGNVTSVTTGTTNFWVFPRWEEPATASWTLLGRSDPAGGGYGSVAMWGDPRIVGAAPLASPAFTGTPAFPASGVTIGTDVNLYRVTADNLRTDDALQVGGLLSVGGALAVTSATTLLSSVQVIRSSGLSAFLARVTGDTVDRLRVDNGGRHEWGNGTSAADTVLYRNAAGVLKTDGQLVAAGGVLAAKNSLASRTIVGRNTSAGPPTSGTWTTDDEVIDAIGVLWVCTAGGTPGTWIAPSQQTPNWGSPYAAGGECNGDRRFWQQSASTALSGDVVLTYFRATKTETINNLVQITSGTAAGTVTFAAAGVYQVATNGDLTRVARTANDTTLFNTTFTSFTRATQAAWSKQAGQLYATATLVVATAVPSLVSVIPASGMAVQDAVFAREPRLSGRISSQTDLLTSYTAASVLASRVMPMCEMLP